MAVATNVVLARVVSLWAPHGVNIQPEQVEEAAEEVVANSIGYAEGVPIIAKNYLIDSLVNENDG